MRYIPGEVIKDPTRKEISSWAKQAVSTSEDLSKPYGEVDNSLSAGGREFLVGCLREYQKGMDTGELAANARTTEEARERLAVMLGMGHLEQAPATKLKRFIEQWYQPLANQPEESRFREANRNTPLGKVARLEWEIAREIRKGETLDAWKNGHFERDRHIAGIVADALEVDARL